MGDQIRCFVLPPSKGAVIRVPDSEHSIRLPARRTIAVSPRGTPKAVAAAAPDGGGSPAALIGT